jgi:tripeptidyl-peptidase-1
MATYIRFICLHFFLRRTPFSPCFSMLAFFQFVCLAVAVRASPLPSHVHQHARSIAPNGFSHIGPATPEQQITFRVALKANNVSGLQERLASISDPRSSTYGQWLSAGA